jgi:hypothetical protein
VWYFSHQNLVIYLFPSQPIKLKPGLQIGGRLLIAKHLDQLLWMADQKQGARTYLLHSSQAGVRLCCSFTSLSKGCRNAWPKPFCSAELACFDFSSSNENMQGPIESNGGVKVGTPLKVGTHWTAWYPSENLRKHFPNGQMMIRRLLHPGQFCRLKKVDLIKSYFELGDRHSKDEVYI